MKVLIIDDEENIRFLLCNFLKKFESELQIVEMCIRDRLRGEVSASEALNLSPSKRRP